MARASVIICLTLGLTGCTLSSAERNERQREMMAANAEASCRAIGLDETNQRWTDCMIEMMAAEKHSNAARQVDAETQGKDKGLSFMCKNAISRGDTGGTFIFC